MNKTLPKTIAAVALFLALLMPVPQGLAQTEKELLESTAEIEKFVTSFRGLDFLHPVPRKVQSKKQTERFLIERISEEFSEEEIDGAERLLKLLGLLPPDYDYYSSMVEMMTEQIAGMYDHQEKFLALADWIPLEMQEPILVHEMTHALQDQHYGLENFLSPDINNDDRALALASLIEGDASLVMFAYSMAPLGQAVTDIEDYVEFHEQQAVLMDSFLPLFSAAPSYIKRTIMFPYSYGSEFVKEYLLKFGWSEMEQLYQNPPSTTEQIIHPEKYFGIPELPRDAGKLAKRHFDRQESGESEIISNVLGEFTIYLMLRQHLDETASRQGADGWDGDMVTLKKISGEKSSEILQMTFCWDSEAEAHEFLEAYDQYLLKKYMNYDFSTSEKDASLSRIKKENRIDITSDGSTVFIIQSFPG